MANLNDLNNSQLAELKERSRYHATLKISTGNRDELVNHVYRFCLFGDMTTRPGGKPFTMDVYLFADKPEHIADMEAAVSDYAKLKGYRTSNLKHNLAT